jgi:hypothetical protein
VSGDDDLGADPGGNHKAPKGKHARRCHVNSAIVYAAATLDQEQLAVLGGHAAGIKGDRLFPGCSQ